MKQVIQQVRTLSTARHSSTKALLTCYLAPLMLQAFIASHLVSAGAAWTLFSLGLTLALCGAVPLYLLLREWEQAPPQLPETKHGLGDLHRYIDEERAHEVPDLEQPESTTELLETIDQISSQLAQQEELVKRLSEERHDLQAHNEELEGRLDDLTQTHQHTTHHHEILLAEHKHTVTEQRAIIERKQDYILKLENKNRDLLYEVKTLLQLSEGEVVRESHTSEDRPIHPVLDVFEGQIPCTEESEASAGLPVSGCPESKVQTAYDASLQLQKCIEIAKQLTGAAHLTEGSRRLLDLSSESYAIDLRRLFDSYRNENASSILFLSRKEDKILFVNNQIRSMLGWSPDKVSKDFTDLIQEGWVEWKHALNEVTADAPIQARLLMQTRDGGNLLVHCHLGLIATGAFAGHVVGILYAD